MPSVVGEQQSPQVAQDMRPRHAKARLFQQRFQVFFAGLLAMKTNAIVIISQNSHQIYGAKVISLCLFHPCRRQLFHKALFPW